MRHRDKNKPVHFGLKKLELNRTYKDRSWYAKHGLGYHDLVYDSHEHWNPTKKYCLNSHNVMLLIEVT